MEEKLIDRIAFCCRVANLCKLGMVHIYAQSSYPVYQIIKRGRVCHQFKTIEEFETFAESKLGRYKSSAPNHRSIIRRTLPFRPIVQSAQSA